MHTVLTTKNNLMAALVYRYYSLREAKHVNGCRVLMVMMILARAQTDQMEMQFQHGSPWPFGILGHVITNKVFSSDVFRLYSGPHSLLSLSGLLSLSSGDR